VGLLHVAGQPLVQLGWGGVARAPAASSGPPAVTFTATDWTGNRLWLNGDPASLTLSGSDVTAWASQGGYVGSLTTGAIKPVVGSTYNGHSSISFDGVSQEIGASLDTANVLSVSAFSLYAVVSFTSYVNTGAYTSFADIDPIFGDLSQYVVLGGDAGSGGQAVIAAYDAGYKTCKVTVATGTLVVLSARLGSGTLRLSVNGGTDTTVACGDVDGTGNLSLGQGHSKYANVAICELATYNVDHTGTNDAAIVAALMGKYGIT
jgi:hypothetical protein